MAVPPDFVAGQVLTAAQMNAVGLWLVKTQAVGTAVSSVIVTNAFSADYNNYLIMFEDVTFSDGNVLVAMQMRTGTTTSTASYYASMPYLTYGGAAGNFNTNNGSSFGAAQRTLFATKNSFGINIYAPFLASRTLYSSLIAGGDLAAWSAGFHDVATSYDQVVFTPAAGTMTGGNILVYGYRN